MLYGNDNTASKYLKSITHKYLNSYCLLLIGEIKSANRINLIELKRKHSTEIFTSNAIWFNSTLINISSQSFKKCVAKVNHSKLKSEKL